MSLPRVSVAPNPELAFKGPCSPARRLRPTKWGGLRWRERAVTDMYQTQASRPWQWQVCSLQKTCAAGDAPVLKTVEAGVPRRGAACPGSHSGPKAGPGLTPGLSGLESVLHPLPTPLPEMPQVTLEHPTGKADVSTPKPQGKEAPSCPLSSAPPSTLPEPSCPPMPVAGSLISQSRCGLARPTFLVTLPVTECRGLLPSPRPWWA